MRAGNLRVRSEQMVEAIGSVSAASHLGVIRMEV